MNKDIPTHAVKAVIRNNKHEILFLQRNPARGAVANWDLPGGIVENGEDDETALRREIREELSVDATVGNKLGTWSFFRPFDKQTVQVTNYEASLSSFTIQLSDEHIDFVWISDRDIRQLQVKDKSIFTAIGE